MSENDQSRDLPERDEDRDMREGLGRHTVESSDLHDSSVLHAAKATGREIRNRKTRSRPNRVWRQSWVVPFAAAASLVVVAYLFVSPDMGPVVSPDTTVRGMTVENVIPAHRDTIAAAPRQFQWPVQSGATGYRVTLRDANADPVWSGDLVTDNSVVVPQVIRTGLNPGTTYLWTVDVEGPVEEAVLGPYWFRITE